MGKAFPMHKRRKSRVAPVQPETVDRDLIMPPPRKQALLDHVTGALDDVGNTIASAAERTADFVGGQGNFGLPDDDAGPDGMMRQPSGEVTMASRGITLGYLPLTSWYGDLLWSLGFLIYVLAPLALFGYCMLKGLNGSDVFIRSQAAAICFWAFSVVMMTISHF